VPVENYEPGGLLKRALEAHIVPSPGLPGRVNTQQLLSMPCHAKCAPQSHERSVGSFVALISSRVDDFEMKPSVRFLCNEHFEYCFMGKAPVYV
jgi:hypothetical protein